jgi:hypothetical protein
VVRRFIELQGNGLEGGLVFRQFVPLQSIGRHSQSGMPLTKEFRCFFLDGEVLQLSHYWAEGEYAGEAPLIAEFQSIAATIQSRFFTMDIAQREDGTWIIVELGDGQVAGLPDASLASEFYVTLRDRATDMTAD